MKTKRPAAIKARGTKRAAPPVREPAAVPQGPFDAYAKLDEYVRQRGRRVGLSTVPSLRWAIRTHEDALLENKALARAGSEVLLHVERFEQTLIEESGRRIEEKAASAAAKRWDPKARAEGPAAT